MYHVDLNNEYGDIIIDPKRKIPDAHLRQVCHYGEQNACRYLCLGPNGFVCVKASVLKDIVDHNVLKGNIKANSDNCEGLI